MALFDTLRRAEFAGVPFPWDDLAIQGRYRHHVHEYRHTDGGDIEKQGRTLYTLRFNAVFDENLETSVLPGGANGYPKLLLGLQQLQECYERGTTAALVVPTMGTLPCFITSFERHAAPVAQRSGERATLEFLEDSDVATTVQDLVDVASVDRTAQQVVALRAAIAAAILADPQKRRGLNDPFDALASLIGKIGGLKDQGELFEAMVSGKLEQLAQMCARLDSTVQWFAHPENHLLLEQFKELWSSFRTAANDIKTLKTSKGKLQVRSYTVPRTSTIQQVSIAIYGRSDRSFDIMQINDIADALAIPAGTTLKYITEAPQRAA